MTDADLALVLVPDRNRDRVRARRKLLLERLPDEERARREGRVRRKLDRAREDLERTLRERRRLPWLWRGALASFCVVAPFDVVVASSSLGTLLTFYVVGAYLSRGHRGAALARLRDLEEEHELLGELVAERAAQAPA